MLYTRKVDVGSFRHLTVSKVVPETSKVKRTGLGKHVSNRHTFVDVVLIAELYHFSHTGRGAVRKLH